MNKKTQKPVPEGNVTKEKLAGTPFKSASELNEAREEILKETWCQLEKARATKELVKKDEYRFFVDVFRRGLLCKYGESNDNLVRVFLSEDGVQIAINEEMRSQENNEYLLGALIKSMSESFLANYLRAMGILPPTDVGGDNKERGGPHR